MNTKKYREQLAEDFSRILEEKQLDWKKEWIAQDTPVSVRSGKPYRGMNRFNLTLIALDRGYNDPRWATFKQIKENGWTLKNAKGQGVRIAYWYPYDTEEKKEIPWGDFYKRYLEIGERYQLSSRTAVVFNASLIDGIPQLPQRQGEIISDELINKLSQNMGVPITNDGGGQAYYNSKEDRIHLPLKEHFLSDYAYNSTALHELTHASGAEHRLHRNLSGGFGSEVYAFEELVAEISSCFMSANLRIEQDQSHIDNHKAYIQIWAQHIRERPEELARAIQQAERATAYLEYKAELIPREEFEKVCKSSLEADEKHEVLAVDVSKAGKTDVIFAGEYELRQGLQQIQTDTGLFRNILIVREYERSIGRSSSVLSALDEEGIRQYAGCCERYLEFGREVDRCIQGLLPMREALKVCDTPRILQDAGCNMLPMHMTQKHLKNCIRDKNGDQPHYHGLKIEEIKRIPEELENPAVLSESLSREDSIVAVLGYREQEGLPIIVSIIPGGKASYHLERVDSNFVTSAYGKENVQDFVRRMAENDKLLYMNKEKSEELALLPLQLRQDHPAPAFDCIIKRMGEGVKGKNGASDMVQESDNQKGEEQTMETWGRKIKAERLPEGWTWEMESDGSGHLRSPKGNDFFIYDRTTGECRRTEKDRWNFDYYDDLQEDFTNFRELAERWIERKVLGKEIRPRKIDMKL